ncbi:hypothetical protein [Moorena producens]|uniref:hypothetical protein n=1 Tax=Moorena producens TaxID=1155739 RepID=UPI001314C981|nr:hypothetical protein [Moorena producens]
MQSLMGETTAVAHGGNPQDRAASPRPRCIAKNPIVNQQLACEPRTALLRKHLVRLTVAN